MSDLRLLVFDWDGTLMDSAARIVHCMRHAMIDAGLAPQSPEAIREIIGLGLREAVTALMPGVPEPQVQHVIEAYRHHYLNSREVASQLFPGTHEVLQQLNIQGYRLAVATGKGRRGLQEALDESGVAGLFHGSRCADETQSKPHPQMLEELIAEFAVAPAEVLMIGDTEYDMGMARNAGTHAAAVCYGVHSRERLARYQPRWLLDDIRELPTQLAASMPPA